MKKGFLIAVFVINLSVMFAQSEMDNWRCQHVVKGLKMSQPTAKKFTPVFYAYLKELHEAKDIYDNVKEKYKNSIKKRTLTQEQGKELLNAHWASDTKEVEVRKKYTQLFSKIIKEQYVYYVFTLSNDKKKK